MVLEWGDKKEDDLEITGVSTERLIGQDADPIKLPVSTSWPMKSVAHSTQFLLPPTESHHVIFCLDFFVAL